MTRSKYQSEVTVIGGAKEQTFSSDGGGGETFIWQVSGESVVTVNGGETLMKADETLLGIIIRLPLHRDWLKSGL